jgi:hypothetical protein
METDIVGEDVRRSKVWDYFDYESTKDVEVWCLLCNKVVKRSNNTSHHEQWKVAKGITGGIGLSSC